MEPTKFCVLDFETGGLDPKVHALMSMAFVLLDENLKEFDREYRVIIDEPEKIITPEAVSVNGITTQTLEDEGIPVDVVLELLKHLVGRGYTFVCHNCPFDIAWLNLRTGSNVTEAIDTLVLARRLWPYQKNKLGLVCERMGITVENAHNSLGDVLLTAEVLRKFKEKYFPELGILPERIKFYL
jgi:DNA polymerase-3 subunit epsilon